jgi:conjugal transfer pilus assembly protein TraF
MKATSIFRFKLAAVTLSIATAIGALAPDDAHATRYYDRSAEGWFWYDDPVPPKEPELKKEEPKKEEPKVIVMQAPEPAEPTEPADAGPAPLSAAWFRQNLQVYMDRAIDDPSPENVEAYFLLQRVMMDKAQDFSDMSKRVVTGDPILDESNRRSLDPATARLQENLSSKRREEALIRVLDKAGLVFFFSADCDLCGNQAQALEYLAARTGIEVMPVSLDGTPLPNGVFADTMIPDGGQANALGVTDGPALFLAAPPDQWIPLSFSVVTQEEAITRILMGAVEAGILSEEELNQTKPINITPSLAKNLPKDGNLPEDPRDLIEFLRNLEQQK